MASVFLLAGESSGDRIGAGLIEDLRAHGVDRFSGVGGESMIGQGLAPLFPMSDLAVMGYADVLVRLPVLLLRAHQVVRAILSQRPDVVVLIDAQVFSQVVAERLRRKGYSGPVLLYVAPAVWAWKPERAKRLKPLFDEVLSVLPFEPAVMTDLGGPPTHYVGHPALERYPMRSTPVDKGPLLLLPGSRTGELRRHLPLMAELAAALADHPRVAGLAIPTPSHQVEHVRSRSARWETPVQIASAGADRSGAYRNAVGAVCVSGTATLELALSGIPHIITYVADRWQARHYLKARPRWIGLPNIIAGDDVVPELLFSGHGRAEALIAATRALLDDPEAGRRQAEAFAALRALMEKGAPEAPRNDPGDRILSYIQRPSIGA